MQAILKMTALTRSKFAVIALCGLAGVAAASAVSAAPVEGDVPAVAVKYDAQALGNDAAVRALYGRIVAASREVCPDMSVAPWASEATLKCRKAAVERAVKSVNSPRLAALYISNSKNG